jgi:transcriptional regulator with XRE-family HTH domain
MKRIIFKDLGHFLSSTGTTQKQLADRLGVSQCCISLIRNGKRIPRPRLALALAEFARIPLESVISGVSASDNE